MNIECPSCGGKDYIFHNVNCGMQYECSACGEMYNPAKETLRKPTKHVLLG